MGKTHGAHLKIHCPSVLGREARIELDGVDISHYCQGVELTLSVDGVNQAVVKILVGKLELTAETMVLLRAQLDRKDATS